MSLSIAILGYAGQGQSSFEYWNRDGNEITICDRNTEVTVPAGAQTQLGDDYLKNLGRFDLLVRTPSLHPHEIVIANPDTPNILEKVWSNTNEFMKACPSPNIIGVTGTKGKGTTSTLIAKMLEADGKRVHLGGNIGIPPLELLKDDIKADDWVVLELANFQLIDLQQSPHIAVCLMVAAEHMDWHPDIEEYIAAKQQLFAHQTSDDIAIYYGLNDYSQHIAGVSPGQKIPYMKHPGADVINDEITIDGQVVCKVSELKLLGKHNWQNVCAAVTAVWQVTQNLEAMNQAVTNFSGLPHRIELLRTVNDVAYYNDSFASQPSATIAATLAIEKPKVMIIGGHERGLDLKELVDCLQAQAASIRRVLLIGASGPRVAEDLKAVGFENFEVSDAKTMPEIVKQAQNLAQAGDAVVLSPGFASFDMFKNFEERGLQYKAAVEQL